MKKLLTIFFIGTYLLSTTQLGQLLKLPILVVHYFEHKEVSPGMSFTSFLTLHYKGDHLKGHPRDEDYERDKKLPFMVNANLFSVVFVSPPACSYEVKSRNLPVKIGKYTLRNDLFIDNAFLSSIWQPPKCC